jgi:acyl-CoA synthetase (AMP-forming)/AMP-acid ligase II
MIFTSPHADVTIPEIPLTDLVLQKSPELGDKPALIDGVSGRVITYGQLAGTIRRLACGLSRYGLTKGDVAAIYCPNLPEYALFFHAVASLGGITTMVPPLFTDEEITAQLRDSGAKYLLTVPHLMDQAVAVGRALNLREIFVVGEAAGAVAFSSLLNNDGNTTPVEINPREDLVALPYSSGTTGFPKGVMLTHFNMVAMLRQMQSAEALLEQDTMVCVVPMYHLYGIHIVVNLGLSQGLTIVTLPRYDLEQFLQALERCKVTVAPLVPPLVLVLSRTPAVEQHDLSKLRLIHCGAAPLADSIARACAERLNCRIRFGYGLTEASPLSHVSHLDAEKEKPGSVGYCLPNTQCKIVDVENGAELGPNERGEIWIRGPQVMKGYLGNGNATREMLDGEGWLRSGDIGYADEDGCLFVVDRLKELIKYKGRQVAPAELEAILLSHPAIADACVIPSPDEEAGEIPKAFVVLKGKSTAEEIMAFVAPRVAPHKRIRRVEFIEEIPKSPAGKILRRVLIDRERRGHNCDALKPS